MTKSASDASRRRFSIFSHGVRRSLRLIRAKSWINGAPSLRGFRMILNGECDDLPESAFLFAGTIDDVFAKAKKG